MLAADPDDGGGVASRALPDLLPPRHRARVDRHRPLGRVRRRLDRYVLVYGARARADPGLLAGLRTRLPSDGDSAPHGERAGLGHRHRRGRAALVTATAAAFLERWWLAEGAT